MNRFGDQVFAGARCALKQYRGHFAFGDLLRDGQHLAHRRRVADDLIETELLRALAAKHVHFAAKLARFDRVANRDLKFFEVDRLADKVVGAAAEGRDRLIDQHVRGDHDDNRVRLALAHPTQHV